MNLMDGASSKGPMSVRSAKKRLHECACAQRAGGYRLAWLIWGFGLRAQRAGVVDLGVLLAR